MRLRLKSRTRRGDGFSSETTVVTKPELGARVRLTHRVGSGGQYVFDYQPNAAMELGRDLIAAGRYALELEREIAGERS